MNEQKRQLTGLEINKLIKEQEWRVKNSRIDKIFHSKNKLLIRIRKRENDKIIKTSLFFKIPTYFTFINSFEKFNADNSNFGQLLRKKLNNRIIKEIKQEGFDRIIKIVLDNQKERLYLIIELFNKGSVILTRGNEITAEYNLKKGERRKEYRLPEKTIKEPKPKEVIKELTENEDKEIVKILASNYGFGKTYSEEICKRAGINKLKKAKELNEDEKERLRRSIKKVIEDSEKNKNFIYKTDRKEELSCLELKTIENKESKAEAINKKEFKVFAEAVKEFYNYEKEKEEETTCREKHSKAKTKEEVIIEKQKENLKKLKEEMKNSKESAEKIYEHYTEIKKIIEESRKILKENISNKEKKKRILELNNKLKQEKTENTCEEIEIENINFKEKTITLKIKNTKTER